MGMPYILKTLADANTRLDPLCRHTWDEMLPSPKMSNIDEDYRVCPNPRCPSPSGHYYESRLTSEGKAKMVRGGAVAVGAIAGLVSVFWGFGSKKSS